MHRFAAAVAKSQRPSTVAKGSAKGKGKGKGNSRQGFDAVLAIDVGESDGAQAAGSAAAAAHIEWPAVTRARFTSLLPEFFSPRFGGAPPVLGAHSAISDLFQCLCEDGDTDVAGVFVQGASDAQVRGYTLNSGTLTPALVSEWIFSAVSPALRSATLPSMSLAFQRVVNRAMDATGAWQLGVTCAAAWSAAAAATPSAPRAVPVTHPAATSREKRAPAGLRRAGG